MAKDPKNPGALARVKQTYQLSKQADPKIGLILLATFLVVTVVVFGVAFAFYRNPVFPAVFAILCGLLVALIVFSRRVQNAHIAQVEGKPGGAASVLGMLRKGWKVEPEPVGFTKQQDIVTRVVGPPGIVLVGEGNPNRLKPLMASERRKHERVTSETPIHEVYVGNGEGQVPLRKLTKHVTKLGRDLKPAEMTDVLQRLRALDANRSKMPVPKGPMPTSMKGMRGNLRGR